MPETIMFVCSLMALMVGCEVLVIERRRWRGAR